MAYTLSQSVHKDLLQIDPAPFASVTVTVLAGGTVYYADSTALSPTQNQGSLTVGQSVTVSKPIWVLSASETDVSLAYADSPTPAAQLPATVALVSQPNTFTFGQTIAPGTVGTAAITTTLATGSTSAGVYIDASQGGSPTASAALEVNFSGTRQVAPYFHWNYNGFGSVGVEGATSPKYFAIESQVPPCSAILSFAQNPVSPGGGTAVISSVSQVGAPNASLNPGMVLRAGGAIFLQSSYAAAGTSTGTSDVIVQTAGAFYVQDFAGTGNAQLKLSRATAACTIRAASVNAAATTLDIQATSTMTLTAGDAVSNQAPTLVQTYLGLRVLPIGGLFENAAVFVARPNLGGAAAKIAFFSATPVVQPAAYTLTFATAASRTLAANTAANVAVTASTQTTPWGFSTQAQADAIPVAINAIRVDLDNAKQVLKQLVSDLSAAAGGNGMVG